MCIVERQLYLIGVLISISCCFFYKEALLIKSSHFIWMSANRYTSIKSMHAWMFISKLCVIECLDICAKHRTTVRNSETVTSLTSKWYIIIPRWNWFPIWIKKDVQLFALCSGKRGVSLWINSKILWYFCLSMWYGARRYIFLQMKHTFVYIRYFPIESRLGINLASLCSLKCSFA